jgi:hypothetical protein
MRINYSKTAMIIYICCFFSCLNSEQLQSKTNQDIIKDLVLSKIFEGIEVFPAQIKTLHLSLMDDNEVGRWISEQLRSEILHRNMILIDSEEEISQISIILENIETQITYRGKNKSIFFKYKNYEREIIVLLSFYLEDDNNKIVFNFSDEMRNVDIIPRSNVERIENSLLPFTIGRKKESKFMKKLLEPMIVSVATLGVIYLFFSLRSG